MATITATITNSKISSLENALKHLEYAEQQLIYAITDCEGQIRHQRMNSLLLRASSTMKELSGVMALVETMKAEAEKEVK